MRDSITFSPQNEHGIDFRILAGSGSGMDVGSIERRLSLEADIIHLFLLQFEILIFINIKWEKGIKADYSLFFRNN